MKRAGVRKGGEKVRTELIEIEMNRSCSPSVGSYV